jgi:hypothetical protein
LDNGRKRYDNWKVKVGNKTESKSQLEVSNNTVFTVPIFTLLGIQTVTCLYILELARIAASGSQYSLQ